MYSGIRSTKSFSLYVLETNQATFFQFWVELDQNRILHQHPLVAVAFSLFHLVAQKCPWKNKHAMRDCVLISKVLIKPFHSEFRHRETLFNTSPQWPCSSYKDTVPQCARPFEQNTHGFTFFLLPQSQNQSLRTIKDWYMNDAIKHHNA